MTIENFKKILGKEINRVIFRPKWYIGWDEVALNGCWRYLISSDGEEVDGYITRTMVDRVSEGAVKKLVGLAQSILERKLGINKLGVR